MHEITDNQSGNQSEELRVESGVADQSGVLRAEEGGGSEQQGGVENPYDFGMEDSEQSGELRAESGGSEHGGELREESLVEEPYEVEWGEGMVENEALREMLVGHAKAAGLPAGDVGRFLGEVVASIRADEERAFKADDDALRSEWGRDYEHRMSEARAFARRLSERSGVSMEEMGRAFANPSGFRLMYAMCQAMGEGGLKGAQSGRSAADEARAVLQDPSHRFYQAIVDPSHPKWKEANAYYNRLVGLRE